MLTQLHPRACGNRLDIHCDVNNYDHMVIFTRDPMRTVQVVEAKANFSALLAAVEAGEEIVITRHGKVVARMVPDVPRSAADLFREGWQDADIDLVAPEDMPPGAVGSLD